MNDIINKFLLGGDKFMPETELRDLKVGTYSGCGPFTRPKDRINKFRVKLVTLIFYIKMN